MRKGGDVVFLRIYQSVLGIDIPPSSIFNWAAFFASTSEYAMNSGFMDAGA
jgi:hypothetical protein